mmetsp:Transcript_8589/g.35956  ORF Transcript_8589/g.35956 Transcript_8589/m.35956 type:complete len:206 (+) Transcript_8589:2310-2927(+)
MLVRAEHRHAVFLQQRRREHGDELEQQVRLRRKQVRHGLLEALLEVVRARAGHAVPRLRRAEVVVVHGVQSVVFEVPAERGEGAPKVQPGHQDSGDVVVHAPEQRAVLAVVVGVRDVIGRTQHAPRSRPGLGMSRHVVQVPRVRRRRVLRRVARAVVQVPDTRERASVRGGVDVRAVVHVHGVPAALLHHAPEVLLDDRDRRALS